MKMREKSRENHSGSQALAGHRKALFLTILALAWPTLLEQMLQTLVQYIDAAMVGRIGAEATATVRMSTSVTWLVNGPLFAMGIGFMAFISREMGAEAFDNVKRASVQAVIVTVVTGIGVGVLTLAVSPILPTWMGVDPAIKKDASLYFAIICLPMLFRSAIIIFGALLRAVGDTKTPMYVNVCMNLVNIVLNYLFIYDTRMIKIGGASVKMFGFGYGAVGAGIGTAVSFVVGGIFMTIVLYKNRYVSPAGCEIRPEREIMEPCIRVGFPVAMERMATCLGHVVFASLVTGLGTVAFAAHSIALTVEQAFYIPGYGMQAAAATLAGNAIGAKDQKRLHELTRMLIVIILVIMTVSGALLFFMAPQLLQLFTKESDVIALGTVVLRMVAVSEPLFGVLIILEGIFNGVGDTVKPFYYALFSMWCVRVLGTFFCVKVFHLGLYAVWGCMIASNVCLGSLFILRYLRGGWNPLNKEKSRK